MLLTFAASASKPVETQTPAETTTEETAAPAAENGTKTEAPAAETTDSKTYKVAMICDSSINDGGWGAACYNAMIAAMERKGWQAEVTDSISQDAYYDSIVACMLGLHDMIYAPRQPVHRRCPAGSRGVSRHRVRPSERRCRHARKGCQQERLLPSSERPADRLDRGRAGWLMTESGKLGFIGGMELDTTKGKIAGFEEAAKYVGEKEGKTVELLNVPYANSFSDAPKGKEFATELIAQGADVFFGDASAVDSGAREAIDAANAAAGEIKIFDIGQPADILGQNECIICSQVTDNSAMVAASMEAVEAGTFGGEVLYGTLQNGTLSAGALSDLVPADVQEKYLSYIEEMKNDTFMK